MLIPELSLFPKKSGDFNIEESCSVLFNSFFAIGEVAHVAYSGDYV